MGTRKTISSNSPPLLTSDNASLELTSGAIRCCRDPSAMNFCSMLLSVEEKVDGANLGISFEGVREISKRRTGAHTCICRGFGQWKKLRNGLSSRTDELFESLTNQYILFGEWCYAQHSVFYDRLPDWFLGFDIYDKQSGRFLSSDCRDALFKEDAHCPSANHCSRAFYFPRARETPFAFKTHRSACGRSLSSIRSVRMAGETGQAGASGIYPVGGAALVAISHQAKPSACGGLSLRMNASIAGQSRQHSTALNSACKVIEEQTFGAFRVSSQEPAHCRRIGAKPVLS